MGQPLIDYFPQYEGSNSVVLSGGKLTVYAANTTSLINLYSDIDLTLSIENPVTLDASGMIPDVYYGDGLSVKIEIREANGSLFKTKDNLPAFGGPTAGVSVWSSGETYVKGEEVVYNGNRYFSNLDNNIGNVPVDASIHWTRSPFQGVWNTFISYEVTDRVVDPTTGLLYIARTATTGDDPSTSPTQWANGTGIGTQTINIPPTALVGRTTGNAELKTIEVGNSVTPIAIFDPTAAESLQLGFTMPASYDNTKTLMAQIRYTTETAATGTAKFYLTAFGLLPNENLSLINFETRNLPILLDGGIVNQFYLSDIVPIDTAGVLGPTTRTSIQIYRDATDDDYSQELGIIEIILFFEVASSVDNVI